MGCYATFGIVLHFHLVAMVHYHLVGCWSEQLQNSTLTQPTKRDGVGKGN